MRPLFFNIGVPESLWTGLIAHCNAEAGELQQRSFPDQESYLRILSDCAGRTAAVACSLNDPNRRLLPLLLVADTLRDLGAESVGLVAPYLAYMRQDRRFHAGEAVTAQYFPDIISNHFDWLTTVDPHLHRIASLDQVYKIPARAAQSSQAIGAWLKEHVDKPVLIGPDVESRQWVAAVAEESGAPWLVLEKTRISDDEVRVTVPEVEAHTDRTPVVIDDIVSTGRTMLETVRHLLRTNLVPPVCVGVHGIFAGDAYRALGDAGAARIVTCNTIAHPSNAVDVSPQLAAAVATLLGSA